MAADDKAVVSSSAKGGDALSVSELSRLGKYQIEKKIGQGGMGAVYLARDTELKRVVALKVLPQDKASNPTLVRRFKAEAQAAAQLRHNNIVAVYDSGEADGFLYIAMEYVEGQDLYEMVSKRGVVPVKRSIEIIKQVAQALQHAHEQNIVHRDIKPSNLLIRRDGVVKLTDLGLARSIDDTLETNITRAGTTVGTVDYMSPEQARNSKLADTRSDLYSLGCTWYQMLTASAPYPEGSVTNKLQAHAVKPIPDPRDKNPAVPEGLTAVIHRLMAKKPEDRYQTPADLINDLNQVKLSQASISQQIFSDLSDYDQNAVVQFEDEELSDDYLSDGDTQPAPETPDVVPVRNRKKSASTRIQQDDEEIEDSRSVTNRNKSRVARDESDNEDEDDETEETYGVRKITRPSTKPSSKKPSRVEQDEDESEEREDAPVAQKSTKPSSKKPTRIVDDEGDDSDDEEPDQTVVGRRLTKPSSAKPTLKKPSRVADAESGEDDDEGAEATTRKPRGKSSKSDSSENQGSSKASNSKSSSQDMPKVQDSKSSKTKTVSQKPLPPKREPLPEEADQKSSSKEMLIYLGAAAGVVLVIGGLGLLIARYGNEMPQPPTNPLANVSAAQNSGVSPLIPKGVNAQPETAAGENSQATAITNNPKGDAPQQPFDVEKMPDWAGSNPDNANLQQLTVGPAAKTATHFNSLEEALLNSASSGSVIRLLGNGPFPLPRVELQGHTRIVITAGATQERPVITLNPAEGQTTAGLRMSEGRLELTGIHFVIERRLISSSFKAVEVVDGQLVVRECSFTSIGAGSNTAVAMAVSSLQDSNAITRLDPTTLIDQVVVRGDGLTGFSIQRANMDAVIRNSLFASGSASAIEVSGHVAPGVSDIGMVRPRRVLRVVHSTICSQTRAFDLAVDEAGKPPRTAVVLRDSLCCSLGDASRSAAVYVGRWPHVQSATESWLSRLTWASTTTLYIGFEQLVDLNASFKVADATNWQRVWNSRVDPRQFQKFAFPEAAIENLSMVQPAEFDPKGLSYRDFKASDGGLPGCEVSKLILPDVGSQNQVKALSSRPTLPAIVVNPPAAVEVRRVDLKKEDLGAVLNRGDWSSGTQFEAVGGGLCSMSPARIEGKSVRIVFRQSEGTNFKLQLAQPKSANASRMESPAALISIARGSIELTNASLEGYPSSNGLNPDWLIQATDSTVVLNGCRLQGSESEAVKQLGLIKWLTNPTGQSSADPALVCRDCYLAGSGTGIRMDAGRGNVYLRNSVLALRGDAIDIRPIRTENALVAMMDVESTTLSATGAVVRFEAAPGDVDVDAPMKLFFDRCVFAPPLLFKAGEAANATLLRCVGPVMEQHQLSWWGASNGAARQIVHLIREDSDPTTPDDLKTGLTAWRQAWDKTGNVRFLTGDKGIYLMSELPGRWKDLRPGSFELHKASHGTTWADGGLSIGANTHAVEAAIAAKKPVIEAPSKSPLPPVAPARKNDLGF